MVYLTDREASLRYKQADIEERALPELHKWAGIKVEEYSTFLKREKQFFVYGQSGWLASKLVNDGARVELVYQDNDQILFKIMISP